MTGAPLEVLDRLLTPVSALSGGVAIPGGRDRAGDAAGGPGGRADRVVGNRELR
jgi:hypothetical protein